MKYKAIIDIGGEAIEEVFEISTNPIEYLWGRYGMSSNISVLVKLDEEEEEEKSDVAEVEEE